VSGDGRAIEAKTKAQIAELEQSKKTAAFVHQETLNTLDAAIKKSEAEKKKELRINKGDFNGGLAAQADRAKEIEERYTKELAQLYQDRVQAGTNFKISQLKTDEEIKKAQADAWRTWVPIATIVVLWWQRRRWGIGPGAASWRSTGPGSIASWIAPRSRITLMICRRRTSPVAWV